MGALVILLQLVMQPGEAQVINLAGSVVRMAVGDGDIIDTRTVGDDEVVVMALQPGFSQLLIWHGDTITRHNIQVISPSDLGLQKLLTELENKERELVVEHSGSVIVVSGQASADSRRTLAQLAERFPQLIVSLEAEQVTAATLIELEVRVIEFKKRGIKSLGIRWQQVSDGPLVGIVADTEHRNSYAYGSIAAELSSRIQLLEERGEARMLASPVLRTESGTAAEFLAGGEVPLPQTNAQGSMEVDFRSYGIRLSIEPAQLDDGTIRTEVLTEVSNLDPAVSIAGLPGLLTRRAESVVALPPGQTFVISGLISEESAFNRSGPPPLSHLPGLGGLFNSTEQQSSETELVIFITPRLVNEELHKQRIRLKEVDDMEQRLAEQACRGMRSYL